LIKQLIQKLPERVRLPVLTAVYGVSGGLSAVAFMLSIHHLHALLWPRLMALGAWGFLAGSFVAITVSSLIAGVLVTRVCPGSAGSGIPQIKASYWNDMGEVPFRSVVVRFLAGVISLAGGTSLGTEGPTVCIGGGLASNAAGWLGIDRRKRRRATAAGAAAGLAAAFNTPLAAICYVLEEILGDFNSRLLGGVMLASVAGAFVVTALIGAQPAFMMPKTGDPAWSVYLAVPVVAAIATLAAVLFQRYALGLRLRLRESSRLPRWALPAAGSVGVWIVGCAVYFACGRIGIFGVGYSDLSEALADGMGWRVAGLLAVGKLAAAIISYGSGGSGGVFSPTLFIGGMCGFFTAGVLGIWIPLTASDRLILAATGMSCCFGAVVRAPVTSVLMVFEMTHQFAMVPALLLGTLVSQGMARLALRESFDDGVLRQDGREPHRVTAPRNLAVWRGIEVAALGSGTPVVITDLRPEVLRQLLHRHHYRCFPVLIEGQPPGVVTRMQLEQALAAGTPPVIEKAVTCLASQTLDEIEPMLIQSDVGLFLVREQEGGPIVRLFTLHDLIRAQADIFE